MPSGSRISGEKREVILELANKGLTTEQIAMQVGLSQSGCQGVLYRAGKRARVTPKIASTGRRLTS